MGVKNCDLCLNKGKQGTAGAAVPPAFLQPCCVPFLKLVIFCSELTFVPKYSNQELSRSYKKTEELYRNNISYSIEEVFLPCCSAIQITSGAIGLNEQFPIQLNCKQLAYCPILGSRKESNCWLNSNCIGLIIQDLIGKQVLL